MAIAADTNERKAFNAMLDAQLQSRYWNLMALRYLRRETNAKIFLAVTASATVASWAIWKANEALWQSLSAASAIISVVLPIVDAPRKIDDMAEVQWRWQKLMHEYEALYGSSSTLSQIAFDKRFKELRAEEADISKKTSRLPTDDVRLAKRCQAEIIKARGL
jgi:hypothetical protein